MVVALKEGMELGGLLLILLALWVSAFAAVQEGAAARSV